MTFLNKNEWKITHKNSKPVYQYKKQIIPTKKHTTPDLVYNNCIKCEQKFDNGIYRVFIKLFCGKPLCNECFKEFMQCPYCYSYIPKRWMYKNLNSCALCLSK